MRIVYFFNKIYFSTLTALPDLGAAGGKKLNCFLKSYNFAKLGKSQTHFDFGNCQTIIRKTYFESLMNLKSN